MIVAPYAIGVMALGVARDTQEYCQSSEPSATETPTTFP
jgi:hypothetical protein